MESTKLTQEQLDQITDIQQKYQAVAQEFGNIEIQKLALKARKELANSFLAELKQQESELAQSLEATYGKGVINLEKGEFIPSEEKVQE